eukprot:SAG11_NODE_9124_length_940_cov_1.221165_1_plen_128_part_00
MEWRSTHRCLQAFASSFAEKLVEEVADDPAVDTDVGDYAPTVDLAAITYVAEVTYTIVQEGDDVETIDEAAISDIVVAAGVDAAVITVSEVETTVEEPEAPSPALEPHYHLRLVIQFFKKWVYIVKG